MDNFKMLPRNMEDIAPKEELLKAGDADKNEEAAGEDNVYRTEPQGERKIGEAIPGDIVLTFGRHKGRTINYVNENDPGYISWLTSNALEEEVREAGRMLLESREEAK